MIFRRFLAWVRRFWRPSQRASSPPLPPQEPHQEEPPEEPPEEPEGDAEKPVATKRRRKNEDEGSIIWTFKGEILDRLDEYFACMKQMKRADEDSYDAFSRIGLAITADRWVSGEGEWSGLGSDRASMGGVMVSKSGNDDEDDNYIVPSFIYFRKMASSFFVEKTNASCIYSLYILYDDRFRSALKTWKTKGVVPTRFHVGVSDDGNVTLLRELLPHTQVVTPRKRRKGKSRQKFVIEHAQQWKYPLSITELAAQKKKTPQELAQGLFRLAFRSYEESMAKIVVCAERDGIRASWGIELSRAPYFFADRDVTVRTPSGAKKRIFHAVREHTRQMVDGRTVTVAAHYRGIRTFDWNGSHITITWPEITSRLLISGDAPAATYEEDADDKHEWMSSADYAAKLRTYLDADYRKARQ